MIPFDNQNFPPGRYNHWVVVRFASKGEQLGRLYAVTNGGNAVVSKWRRVSKRWTSRLYVPVGLVKRVATDADRARFGK